MKKYQIKRSSHGDQYFIMLDSEIIKVFTDRKHACDALSKLNKLNNLELFKKGDKNA